MALSPRFSAIALAASVVALGAAPSAMADDHEGEPQRELTKGEKKLAKLLEGRVAGEPRSCINAFRARNDLKIIDGTALVYGSGKTIYVNYTRNPDDIDDWDTLVTRRFGSQICRTDIVTKVDATSGIYAGNVFLSDFIPYTRVKKDDTES